MFDNRQELTDFIRQTMSAKNIGMLEAILHICDRYNIEEEVIAVQIRKSHKLKDELREEATALKLVKA